MPAQAIPDLTTDQLAELDDRIRAARVQRDARERAEAGKRQLVRKTRSKLTRVCSEITKTETDLNDKRQTVTMLRQRLEALDSPTQDDPGMTPEERRDEGQALEQALRWATEEGVAITAKVHVPSNTRPMQSLSDASPKGLNWHAPIATLEHRLEAMTQERDRLQTRLDDLEGEDTGAGEVAA